ncbi:unnamed protein product [Onchocerca flexuosa]|uniref:Uncharacterized protein n=1 Tax=Onchocerca flexuosa TaxID=387005 RepID=A0A183HPN0_9BILA|nr:unnamed protein product [Onchocerca flexuosa]
MIKLVLESLLTFGIAEDSRNVLVGIFDDENGEKMVKVAKKIDGKPVPITNLPELVDYERIKKVEKRSLKKSSRNCLEHNNRYKTLYSILGCYIERWCIFLITNAIDANEKLLSEHEQPTSIYIP